MIYPRPVSYTHLDVYKRQAQLWGGRFTKETDKLVYNFNASINFDKKFYKQDMEGSIAHVKMLASVGILTEEERDQIITGIEGILRDVENGSDVYKRQEQDTSCGTDSHTGKYFW